MKKNILFVGSFPKEGQEGNRGGQMFACHTLISSKQIKDVNWVLIDSTASTNKTRSVFERIGGAVKRITKFIYLLFSKDINIVLLFSAYGFSFLEKGTMAFIALLFSKQVIFAPRSGLLINDIEQSRLKRIFIKTVLRKVDKIICQSEYWQHYFYQLAGGEMNKYYVIHNWINTDRYVAKKLKTPAQKELTEPLIILFLGEMSTNKGIYDLVEAIKTLEKESIKVIIAGNGKEYENVQLKVQALGLTSLFDFKGWVDDEQKMKLLEETDIFVLPSYKEGYPNALLEAMASGIPSIASNVGSIPDLIKDGENGYLIKPGNSQQLMEQLKVLTNNSCLRNTISINARNRVVTNNSIAIGVSRFQQLITSL